MVHFLLLTLFSRFSGADLSALVREAAVICLKEEMLAGNSGDNCRVGKDHFTRALANVKPSVSRSDRLKYERMAKGESVSL